MKKAQSHTREEERLKELKSFEILDSLEEKDFDIFTRLSRRAEFLISFHPKEEPHNVEHEFSTH